MEFDPNNNIVKLCLQGMGLEEKNRPEEANRLFLQAWNEATNDFEKFLAAYYVARHQNNVADKLKWIEAALQLALKIDNIYTKGVFPSLYSGIAKCYEELGDPDNAKKHYALANSFRDIQLESGLFYHGTKADLRVGDLLTPGFRSNYKPEIIMNHIYFTALVNGAGLAAEIAVGDGNPRIYVVEPTGDFENDPNVTDTKFPGNPTRSYRSKAPLKIIGEVTEWVKLTPEGRRKWHERLAEIRADSKAKIIN